MEFKTPLAALVSLLLAGAASASGTHAGTDAETAAETAAIGKAGKAADVRRTVTVTMADSMRFQPDRIAARQGETIRFIIKNSGKLKHEMALGTDKELAEHYELMKKNPEMEHADDNMVTVQPGKSGEIIWQFTKAGQIKFACLQPGHYEAGMKGAVNVAASATQKNDHAQHQH